MAWSASFSSAGRFRRESRERGGVNTKCTALNQGGESGDEALAVQRPNSPNGSLVPRRCWVKDGMAGKQRARGMMVRKHCDFSFASIPQRLANRNYQSHNPKRIALDQGATPGDEAVQMVCEKKHPN